MTKEQIETMEAGDEMNRIVATKVMGWLGFDEIRKAYPYPEKRKGHPLEGSGWILSKDSGVPPERLPKWNIFDVTTIPKFSTEISAAWKVVEAIEKGGRFHYHLDSIPCTEWHVRIHDEKAVQLGGTINYSAYSNVVPLAICRAALLVVLGTEGR